MSPSRLARWSFFAGAVFALTWSTLARAFDWPAWASMGAAIVGSYICYSLITRAADRTTAPRISRVGRCGATAGATIWTKPPHPVCALPAGHPGWHRADDGCEWGIPRAATP